MRLDILNQHAADMNLIVLWRDLGPVRRGHYIHDLGLIEMNTRLTRCQAVATYAHEIGHAIFGDRGHHPATEKRADQTGASLIITPDEYAEAEMHVGHHPAALAAELGVTPRLILAWRDWATRKKAA